MLDITQEQGLAKTSTGPNTKNIRMALYAPSEGMKWNCKKGNTKNMKEPLCFEKSHEPFAFSSLIMLQQVLIWDC